MSTALEPDQQQLTATESTAWRGLLRAHAALVRALDGELEQTHGIALTSYEVLARLAQSDAGRMRMCELAESVLLSRSGLTRMVDRLERDGLVARGSCEHDARGAFAVITPEGLDAFRRARVTHLDGIRRHFVGCFSPEELEAMSVLWQRLGAAV
jgi:DNA-binding MarR family transcriptional regulator